MMSDKEIAVWQAHGSSVRLHHHACHWWLWRFVASVIYLLVTLAIAVTVAMVLIHL